MKYIPSNHIIINTYFSLRKSMIIYNEIEKSTIVLTCGPISPTIPFVPFSPLGPIGPISPVIP